jgi:1-acyl-sn-glycerol-3-phosphate acyltransferase
MNYLILWWVKITSIPLCLAVFKIPKVKGKRPKLTGANILVCNHGSMWDPVLICYLYPFKTLRVLTSHHLFAMSWWFGTLLRQLGAVKIDRESNDLDALGFAATLIEQGSTLIIFPEGRRSLTGELLPFKAGAAYLSFMTDTPVIPVYIERGGYRPFGPRPTVMFGEKVDLRRESGGDGPDDAGPGGDGPGGDGPDGDGPDGAGPGGGNPGRDGLKKMNDLLMNKMKELEAAARE